jgi:C-terminal processing protease CtpA/Prc
MYRSERISKAAPRGEIPSGFSDPRAPFYADLGGVSCLVPLALFADEKGTLPHSPANENLSKPSESRSATSANDRATRLAAVALAWNIFQHFYPYFDVVKTDWDRALRDALSGAASDADARAFLDTLRRLVAQLHDGHGNVFHRTSVSDSALPLLLNWVEGRLVIIRVAPGVAGGLKPGDIVLKEDGKTIDEFIAEREPLISGATPQWIRFRLLQELSFGEKDSEITLEGQRQSGETYSVKLSRTVPLERYYQQDNFSESGLPKIDELKPGIFYLNLDHINDQDFGNELLKLESARGIIFDLRGYPKVTPLVISHLIDSPVTSARWNVPIVSYPDRKQTSFQFSNWPVQPIAPRLKAKIAFITDGRAISYAETFMGIIERYKLGEIVGEPTAGTNGNINPITLPGGYSVVWTGMKVLKHDGSQHHGIGIKPTVPVSRTLRGVAEGRDEFLERAIELVSR